MDCSRNRKTPMKNINTIIVYWYRSWQ